MAKLTYGSFLWQRQQEGRPTRARPLPGHRKSPYDVYPTRELYEDEFSKIWSAQAKYHSSMTDENKDRIYNIIFKQRPLKSQKVGRCMYMPDEDRTFRAMPGFQCYRIYQEVNNLEWTGGKLREHPDARDAIVALLEESSTREVTFSKMKGILRDKGLIQGRERDFKFNFESSKRKGFDSNLTSHIMQHEDYVGPDWHKWSLERQDKFIEIILEDKSDYTDMKQQLDAVKRQLMDEFSHLSETVAEKCMRAPLTDRTANISLKAAHLMLEKMRDGIADMETGELKLPLQNEAAERVAEENEYFVNPMRRRKADEAGYTPADRLPYYGKAFEAGSHIIPGSKEPKEEGNDLLYYGGVSNPTVHIALNQIRKVVNELIGRYGHPESVAIELGRDLPVGPKGRREIEAEQKDNQERNRKLDGALEELGLSRNPINRLRLRLWEELNDDPVGRCCPFSGKKIGKADLSNESIEIDHLLPFSRSLDNSPANKVICTRQANRDKGKRTPFEAFGDSPDGYSWSDIQERVKHLPTAKHWRFGEDAMERWNRDHSDFSERHLNDTRYIGRLAREYLECICHIDKIDVVTGRLTSLLRGHWKLNSVLNENDRSRKNRDDHRHHAVDAIVIGMTSRSMLQKVATAANRAEDLEIEHLFPKGTNGASPIDPWHGFRADVRKVINEIVVSHRARHRKQGQLHNDTAYGIISASDGKDIRHGTKQKCRVVTRKFVADLKGKTDSATRKSLESIRNLRLRQAFLHAYKGGGFDAVKELAKEKGIRRLRVVEENKTVIPIADKSDKPYKAYDGNSNWAMEIYSFPKGHKKADKWDGVTISTFDASQPNFKPSETNRPHPAARLVMRLQKNDCIEIEEENKKRILRRVQKLSDGQITLAPLHEANVDARDRDKEDSFKFLTKSPNSLKQLNARKVHISPAGRVSYEKR